MLLETLGVGSFGKVKRTDLFEQTKDVFTSPRYMFIFLVRPDLNKGHLVCVYVCCQGQ